MSVVVVVVIIWVVLGGANIVVFIGTPRVTVVAEVSGTVSVVDVRLVTASVTMAGRPAVTNVT